MGSKLLLLPLSDDDVGTVCCCCGVIINRGIPVGPNIIGSLVGGITVWGIPFGTRIMGPFPLLENCVGPS